MTKLILNEDVNYSSAFDNARTDLERQNVVADFLRDLQAENPNLNLNNAIGKLQTQLLKQGSKFLNSLTNPGIQALIKFSELNPKVPVSDHMYNDLMGLWGEHVINQNNMLAMSGVGKEDIIFVPAFYELNNYEQQKYMAQVFYWLNNRSNAETLNLEKIFLNEELFNSFCNHLGCSPSYLLTALNVTKEDSTGRYRGPGGKFASESKIVDILSPKDIADLFCFVDNKFNYEGNLRNPTTISNTMDWLDTIQSEVGTKRDDDIYSKAGTSKSRISNLSREERMELFIDGMKGMSIEDIDTIATRAKGR